MYVRINCEYNKFKTKFKQKELKNERKLAQVRCAHCDTD